jgi:hypothetical protein
MEGANKDIIKSREDSNNDKVEANRDIGESSEGSDNNKLYKVEANREVVVNKQRLPLLQPQLRPQPLPYYVFSSIDMFAFLQVQLNHYYFLFEYVYT